MIVEALILGASLVGCTGFWATVMRHRYSVDLQKHKITSDLEAMKPWPEPVPPPPLPPPKKEPTPNQQALTALLLRRANLEQNVTKLRDQSCQYSQYDQGKKYELLRSDALKALDDARREQQELVVEIAALLETMQGDEDAEKLDPAKKSLQPNTGGPVARRVVDSSLLYDAELHDEEASRKGAA